MRRQRVLALSVVLGRPGRVAGGDRQPGEGDYRDEEDDTQGENALSSHWWGQAADHQNRCWFDRELILPAVIT